ncbi:hypothetical protein ACJX0J_019975, partial [Zea mays]
PLSSIFLLPMTFGTLSTYSFHALLHLTFGGSLSTKLFAFFIFINIVVFLSFKLYTHLQNKMLVLVLNELLEDHEYGANGKPLHHFKRKEERKEGAMFLKMEISMKKLNGVEGKLSYVLDLQSMKEWRIPFRQNKSQMLMHLQDSTA